MRKSRNKITPDKGSPYIENIITNQNRETNLQVVFVDIEKYSKRQTHKQILVIDVFTNCLKNAVKELFSQYSDYLQTNTIEFPRDLIILPTGDGAAIIFTFSGVPRIHLDFAKIILSKVYQHNQKQNCNHFEFKQEGYCKDHLNFNIRIGISEGKGIIFKDINGNYNVAGNAINMASRVTDLVDRNQIAFTDQAYNQINELVPEIEVYFTKYSEVSIKNDLKITVYLYRDNEEYINSSDPQKLSNRLAREDLLEEIMEDLNYYGNRYCENYYITTRLEQSDNSKFYICKVKYTYGKIIKDRELLFKIIKIRSEEQHKENENDIQDISEQYIKHEYYYTLNELDLLATVTPEELKNYYKIYNLFINNERKIDLIEIGSQNIELKASIPEDVSLSDALLISYTVEFPIEKESTVSFTFELPTKSIACEFDFSDLKNEIDVNGQAFFSSKQGPVSIIENDAGKIEFKHNKWILPKSSLVFIWWAKK